MLRFLLFLISFTLIAHAEDPIIVNLSATPTLDLISLQLSSSNSPFDKEYQKQLHNVLIFDLNNNGKTHITEKKEAKFTLKGTLQGKNLELSLPSGKKETVVLCGTLAQDRRKMHQLADAVFAALYHENGIASSRILYTTRFRTGNEHNAAKWKSEVWEADYDGENAHPLTKEGGMCVAPTFAPLGKRGSFFYVSYKTGQSKIFLSPLNHSSEKRKVSQIRGNQLMPAFSPRTKLLAFVSDATGNPEVFIQSFTEKNDESKPWQATFAPQGAQGSPTFSPDGKKLAFVSNKDGVPRIYIMDVPTAHTKITHLKPFLITKQNRDNTSPSWSPDGKKLAFCALTKGIRQLWIYDFMSKKEMQLTEGPGHKENPAWAGNSSHIFYDVTEKNSSDLYFIHLTQREPVKISKGNGDKRFPSWIPFST